MGRGMVTYPDLGDFVYSIHCSKEKDYELGCIGKHCQNTLSDAHCGPYRISLTDLIGEEAIYRTAGCTN